MEENVDKIKVFSSEDDKLKILGELLSNKTSRDIIRLLTENEMYTNAIARKLNMRPNLVIHHLQKMESIRLLEITNKKIVKKGEEHRFFKISKGILIIPNEPKKVIENGMLKKIFKEGVKISAIFGICYTSLSLFRKDFREKTIFTGENIFSNNNNTNENLESTEGIEPILSHVYGLDDIILVIIATLSIVTIPWILFLIKNKKRG